MRSTFLAMAALLVSVGPAFSQGATGGGNPPASSTSTMSAPSGGAASAANPGSMGTGTTANDKAGAGTNMSGAVQQQTPAAGSSEAPRR